MPYSLDSIIRNLIIIIFFNFILEIKLACCIRSFYFKQGKYDKRDNFKLQQASFATEHFIYTTCTYANLTRLQISEEQFVSAQRYAEFPARYQQQRNDLVPVSHDYVKFSVSRRVVSTRYAVIYLKNATKFVNAKASLREEQGEKYRITFA